MPLLWELCDRKSRAILGYLFKEEQGYWPDWDERSGKTKKLEKPTYDHAIEVEPEVDPELVRDMAKPPQSQRHVE
uniref:Uncharacterized protein n=1 Tax=viral metagenome TaxID=1070528 RepID=A0A6M3K6F1_9ZZZZ